MNQLIALLVGIVSLGIGAILGYFARQSIAKRDYANIEAKIQKRISQCKSDTEAILTKAKEKALKIITSAKKEIDQRQEKLFKTEKLLLKRENILDERISDLERGKKEFRQKVERLREIKKSLESLEKEARESLEKISGFSKEEAKKE